RRTKRAGMPVPGHGVENRTQVLDAAFHAVAMHCYYWLRRSLSLQGLRFSRQAALPYFSFTLPAVLCRIPAAPGRNAPHLEATKETLLRRPGFGSFCLLVVRFRPEYRRPWESTPHFHHALQRRQTMAVRTGKRLEFGWFVGVASLALATTILFVST